MSTNSTAAALAPIIRTFSIETWRKMLRNTSAAIPRIKSNSQAIVRKILRFGFGFIDVTRVLATSCIDLCCLGVKQKSPQPPGDLQLTSPSLFLGHLLRLQNVVHQ